MNASPSPEAGHPEEPEEILEPTEVHQDSFRKVCLGQVSDPLYPVHPGRPESSDEELLRAAMEDPAADFTAEARPTPWRIIVLIGLAVLALGMVFLWRK